MSSPITSAQPLYNSRIPKAFYWPQLLFWETVSNSVTFRLLSNSHLLHCGQFLWKATVYFKWKKTNKQSNNSLFAISFDVSFIHKYHLTSGRITVMFIEGGWPKAAILPETTFLKPLGCGLHLNRPDVSLSSLHFNDPLAGLISRSDWDSFVLLEKRVGVGEIF